MALFAWRVAASSNNLLNVEDIFKKLNFETIRYTDVKGNAAIFAYNKNFEKELFSIK